MDKYEKLKKESRFNVRVIMTLKVLLGKALLAKTRAHVTAYEPKHESFILISNHTDPLDPAYEMLALNRYIRYIASDHLVKSFIGRFAFLTLGGAIVKRRDKSSEELNRQIIDNLTAGIPVGIHAEGGTSVNGATGYISENTARLVKESQAALITFRIEGGYLRSPRWAVSTRSGPIFCRVAGEYSPEDISKMSVAELAETIRRDTFVNAYERQRAEKRLYKGKNLACHCERVLYMCPKCEKVGELHSSGDELKCDSCGYKVVMGEDGFFHDCGEGLVYDNIYDWDVFQRERWRERLLGAKEGECIYKEERQRVFTVRENKRVLLSDSASVAIYSDSFVISYPGETLRLYFDSLKNVQLASRESLMIIGDGFYYNIKGSIPRAPGKYVAAWRYLTGREYL